MGVTADRLLRLLVAMNTAGAEFPLNHNQEYLRICRRRAVSPFLVLYQFPCEALRETRNVTVHGFICTALARTSTGYRLYWGIYVRRVSWLTRPYLIAIEPFRRILYQAMLHRIRRAWVTADGCDPQ
jgi:hypothetical protein